MTAPIEVRSATEAERDRVVSIIVAAFVTDPMTRFSFPEPDVYLKACRMVTEGMGGLAFEHGTAWVAGDFEGAALWLPPGVHADDSAMEPVIPLLRPERIADGAAQMKKIAEAHPSEPHWYLPLIGVDPYAQGRGVGAALMKHALQRVDEEGAMAYLESSNPRNISLYERHGFEAICEISEGAAPVVTPMVRAPV